MSVAQITLDRIPVAVKHSDDGHEGPGRYVWELDCEEEGYVLFTLTRPSIEQLREVCPQYTEEGV